MRCRREATAYKVIRKTQLIDIRTANPEIMIALLSWVYFFFSHFAGQAEVLPNLR